MSIPQGYKQYSLPTMGGQQKQIYDLLSSQFQQGAPDLYSQLRSMASGAPNLALEAPIKRQYQEEIIPQLAAQYGMSGTHKSSGFQNQIARQGRNLAEDLASQRSQMQQQAIQNLLGLGSQLLGTPTEQFGLVEEAQGPSITELISQAGGALPGLLAELFGDRTDPLTGEKRGIDWGSIGSGAAKILPLLLGL